MPKLLSHKSSAIKKRKVRKNQERSQNRNANRKKRLSKRGVRKYTSNGKPQIRQNDIRKDICPISFAHRLPHIAKTTKFVKRNVGFSVRNFLLAVIEHVAHDNIESIDVIRQSYCQKINDNNVEATVREIKRGWYNGKVRYRGIISILTGLSAKAVGIQVKRICNFCRRNGRDLSELRKNWK